ncbi:DUF1073 domain-containing protein [bacterium]|nr:DUF1073 domain-containing protein [bacterium]
MFNRKLKAQIVKLQDQVEAYANNLGGLTSGGFQNLLTGAGTSLDKTEYSYYLPTRITSKNNLETLYIQSWAAKKFIDIPVDDMFIRWREFTDMENENVELIQQAELDFRVTDKLSRGMKCGNLYGTGLVILITKEAPLNKPLNINRLQRGDLLNILTVDRFDATVLQKDKDPLSLRFGEAELYRINFLQAGSIDVHASRILRFDGFTPLTQTNWQSYGQDWGVPSIIPVVTEIHQDSGVNKGVAHLVSEASVGIQNIEDFADAVAGKGQDGELTLQQRLELDNLHRSVYRTRYMDKEDSFERTEVTFTGLPEIIDRNAKRLAAAASIPATRFWGQAPIGMNATGDSDMKNYAIGVQAEQNKKLPAPLTLLDQVLSKHLGILEPIQYEFPSLIDMSDNEQADVLLKKAQAIVPLVLQNIITEEEGRAALDGDPMLGNLEVAADLPEIEAFKQRALNAEKNQAG